jgi:hypothetical protein
MRVFALILAFKGYVTPRFNASGSMWERRKKEKIVIIGKYVDKMIVPNRSNFSAPCGRGVKDQRVSHKGGKVLWKTRG